MRTSGLKGLIKAGWYKGLLSDIYMDDEMLDYQTNRYLEAISEFEKHFGEECDVEIYSAPGRSEISGNHTDHQQGKVLAASINYDAIAVVERTDNESVEIVSRGYEMVTISLSNLDKQSCEEGTTIAIIKGVLSKMKANGYIVKGFKAYITSDVLIGAGISSSAAFETLIGTIVSFLFNNSGVSPIEIAMIGQYAENEYFGKPCGLMDQMACSVGNLVYIDFADTENPKVERVNLDLDVYGYSLCITDTKGSHADLTSDYAAIPHEMKLAAQCLGREKLGDTTKQEVLRALPEIREKVGDRAALRALHYVCENTRVEAEVEALKNGKFADFLKNVKESGDSSFKYLQNVYTCSDVFQQNLSVALAVSDMVLEDKGVCRVHGGGFAGTIQGFVQNDRVKEYQTAMDRLFGEGSCKVMKIRRYGGIQVM